VATVITKKTLHITSDLLSADLSSITMAENATVDGPMDDIARKTAHDALGVEIYPGTEIMTDGTVSIITARKICSRPECKTDQNRRERTPQAQRQTRPNSPTK
jgi:translation initiation factor 6 (eIF-6)